MNITLENTDFEFIRYPDQTHILNHYLDKVTGDAIALYGSTGSWTMHLLRGYNNSLRYNQATHEEEIVLERTGQFRFRYFPDMPSNLLGRKMGRFVVEGILIKCHNQDYLDIVKLDIDSMEYRFITQVLEIDKS